MANSSEKMVWVEGMLIAESKAPARRALLDSWRKNAIERGEKAEVEIMERAAKTGETPDMIRREMRTEMHIAMENAGLGVRHRAL